MDRVGLIALYLTPQFGYVRVNGAAEDGAVKAIYSDTQIVELTSALAWENYRARFDHALGIEAEGFSEGAFCPLPLPKRGSIPAGDVGD